MERPQRGREGRGRGRHGGAGRAAGAVETGGGGAGQRGRGGRTGRGGDGSGRGSDAEVGRGGRGGDGGRGVAGGRGGEVASGKVCPPTGGSQQAGPSRSAPPRPLSVQGTAEVGALSRDLQQRLSVEEAPPAPSAVQAVSPVDVAPSSSKSIRPPARPGFGKAGRKITVGTNHFPVNIPRKEIYHYDVAITPEVRSKAVNMSIIRELVDVHGDSRLQKLQPVYDRSKSLYTAGQLPFTSNEFVVELKEDERVRTFKVVIKLAGKPDLAHLHMFLEGRHLDEPREAIHALDVALRQSSYLNYVSVARSFYSPSFGRPESLGNGLDCWRGFYSSLRATQMGLSLNIDITATSFYEPMLVTKFVNEYLQLRDRRGPLTDSERTRMKKALRGVRVQTIHQHNVSRRYRIKDLSALPASKLMFSLEDQAREVSVAQYFLQQYQHCLAHSDWPCIVAGSDKRPIFLPMEVCRIVEGQRYTKKLNERQVTSLLRATCKRPEERHRNIRNVVAGFQYANDKYVKQFGLGVSHEPCAVDGRVLPPPMLKYHDSGREKQCQPSCGSWNMNNKRMVNGGSVKYWACVSFSNLDKPAVDDFCRQLVFICQQIGMVFNAEPLLNICADPRETGRVLYQINSVVSKRLSALPEARLQLLLVILPERAVIYGQLKKICETELGIVSQCCMPKHVLKCNKAYLENLSLKINVKVNGMNTVLVDALAKRIPLIHDLPTIIFGADVTHPAPGEDSAPSIAAVVASMDWPLFAHYRCLLSAQTHRQEIIKDLYIPNSKEGLIRKHLVAFRRKTGHRPQRIIFYRDGVSEGQFNEVLLYEMDAIRKACQSLEEDYLPRVTFIVVQKRHHTRFFPLDNNADRSGNILPGTVVDTKICHPTQFDFYLCSHAGIQGTSRPTHYHVLYDENNITADQLQTLTNNLCYTYVRCTRSVSIVPPAYYAHLAAARARYYIDGHVSDQDSSSDSTVSRGRSAAVTLPPVVDNVNDVMFYC